jgi:hypothetical protein
MSRVTLQCYACDATAEMEEYSWQGNADLLAKGWRYFEVYRGVLWSHLYDRVNLHACPVHAVPFIEAIEDRKRR